MFNPVLQNKSRNLDDLDDVLIVRKITAKESDNLLIEDDYEEKILDWDKEQHLLAEEQEILIKKQLQLFQADERGKQALISEISAIKQKQEKRAQALRHRQNALDIEKERAKKIAMLPPPLPASVKLLLRKNDHELELKKPEVQMPDSLQVFHIKGAERHVENKENILSPEELEAKQRIEEERQKKAKKRFNEAIKKDRQEEERSKVMKEIQNAELQNRREIAKSIISENKSIPCPLSDKFQRVQTQADIEAASEKIFKKISKKENVIEDIEGYEDTYEEVFGKIDSGFESKMMDCVPSFLKENYEYLLEDDSKFQGGKNFSGLDDSSDVLNEAYIETSPDYDRLSGSEKLDEVISHLDKMRAQIQTEYDQSLKLLLEAAISEQGVSKKDMSDKAVEAKILKMPAEDKAVETEMLHGISTDSPPLPTSNFLNSGVMAFKRRYEWPRLGSYNKIFIPPMHQRNIHYSVPFSPEPERLTPISWSSSSYCSLPLQHGISATSTSTESLKCDICVAEREKELTKSVKTQTPPKETTMLDKVKSDSLASPLEKSKLSKYVQLLATKYLPPREATKPLSDSALLLQSNVQHVNATFGREVVPKFKEMAVVRVRSDEHPLNAVDKPDGIMIKYDKVPASNSIEMSADKDVILKETVQEISDGRKKSDIDESSNKVSEYNEENTKLFVQQVLGRRIPRFTLNFDSSEEKIDDRPQLVSAKPYIFHELSTIQEVDSALTAESLHASRSKLSNTSAISNENENLELSKDRFKIASLLDPPDFSVIDLAKSIHFVGETQKEVVDSVRKCPVASSETQDSASDSSKMDSPMPSSLSSVSSVSNYFVKSASRPVRKDSKLVSHFLAGNEKDSNSEISGVSSLTPGLFSSNLSSPFSVTGLSTPSAKSTENIGSLASGFTNSPVFTAESEESTALQTDILSPIIGSESSKFQPMTPQYDLPSPSVGSTSNNFQPLTPHYDLASPSDGSASNNFQPLTPHYDSASASNNFQPLTPHYNSSNASNNFQPLTPHYDLASPSDGSASNNFQPLTPHYDSPIHSVGSASNNFQPLTPYYDSASPSDGSASNNFQPLTPHYDSPSPSVGNASSNFQPSTPQYELPSPSVRSTSSKFHCMALQSNISGPTTRTEDAKFQSGYEKQNTIHDKHFIQQRKEMVSSSSSESFSPLTPQSISSPREGNINSEFHGYSKNAENFRLTSMSTISTPSLNDNETGVKHKNISSSISNFYPMKLRIDISSDSASSKASSSNSINNFPQLNYYFKVKAPVPDNIQCIESITKTEQNKVSGASRIHLTDFPDKHFVDKTLSKPESKLSAKVCSSDYFTPKIGLAEHYSSESKQEHQKVGFTRDIDKVCSKAEIISNSKQLPDTDFQRDLLKNEEPTAVCTKDAQNVKKDLEENFRESSHSKHLWERTEAKTLKKPLGHLQLVSSASSSTENLSEISGSRVLHQSTPIKRAEQIEQEPGILEEPNLTLMATKLGNTTMKPHETLNVSDNDDGADKKDKTLPSSFGECKTPTNLSIHLTGSAATPSLMSFLQHEISCEETKITDSESGTSTPVMLESKTDSKERQLTQFPRSEDKQRTKRLWNNLEEVKRKNSEEERKKRIAANRLKAKEYAKKFTPKSKRK